MRGLKAEAGVVSSGPLSSSDRRVCRSTAHANEILHQHQGALPFLLALAAVPGLAGSWVEELHGRAALLR
jgi:hypothetical protein